LLYNGNWHLFAYCEAKNKIRNFALSGIRGAEFLEDFIPHNIRKIEVEKKIENNYGIFIHETEADKVDVVLKFSKDVADIVKNQVWFPLQNLQENKDGTITLVFPVTDFREIEGDVLKFGYHVKVLKPEELQRRIKETLERMLNLY
jgi:predicted DNA-binding transcriptional regulator YafY